MNPDDAQSNSLNPLIDPATSSVLANQIAIPFTTVQPTAKANNGFRTVYYDGTNYYLYVYENGGWQNVAMNQPLVTTKFGGDGSDGALSVSAGTTTIDLANAAVVVKNYTSISITGTGSVKFSNANVNGTVVIFKTKSGAVTMTSSASPNIDMRGVGAQGGAGSDGASGAVGSATASSGNDGKDYGLTGLTQLRRGTGGGGAGPGTNSGGFAGGGASALTAGGQGLGTGHGTAGAVWDIFTTQLIENPQYTRANYLSVGAGAGGGSGGYGNNGSGAASSGGVGGSTAIPNGTASNNVTNTGASVNSCSGGGGGGAGGGALLIECGGALNFTGSINANGGDGGASGNAVISVNGGSTLSACGAPGCGGAGGTVIILYNSLIANSGTITVAGGAAGAKGTASGATVNARCDTAASGGSGFSLVTKNIVFA